MKKNVAKAARGSASGATQPKRRPIRYSRGIAAHVLERLAAGERLRRISADDGMPGHHAVYGWAKRYPDFAKAFIEAKRIGADARADMVLDVAEASTPATVQVDRGRIGALKWHVERDDKLYRKDEPDLGAGRKLIIEVRRFERYVDEADGVTKVREILRPEKRGR